MSVTLPPVPELDADPRQIRRCGTDLLVASARLNDLGTFAAAEARVPRWTGAAATAYHDGLAPTGQRADAMSLALRGVARRVDAHADALGALLDRRVDLCEWRAHLLASAPRPADVQEYAAGLGAWLRDLGAEEAAMAAAFARVLTLEQVEARYAATEPPGDADPAQVHAWWLGLTLDQRRAVIAAAPGAIGNLDGIPAADRDAANRIALAGDPSANARAARAAIDRIERDVDPVTGESLRAQLYTYDPGAFGGDGAVAVAVGDVDTADNVSVIVPGFGTDAESAGYQAQRALNLYQESRAQDPAQTNAAMFWIGYDAPSGLDSAGVVSEAAAAAGGDRLADVLDGLRDARPGDPTHLTVIGHSYGSTTLGHATYGDTTADDLVFTGSPGAGPADHAADLGVDPSHVWSGADSRDPISYLGDHGWLSLDDAGGLGLGADPTDEEFGGTRFTAEADQPPAYPSFDQHSAYFEPGSESLHNLAAIVNGDYADVVAAEPRSDPWWGPVHDPEW